MIVACSEPSASRTSAVPLYVVASMAQLVSVSSARANPLSPGRNQPSNVNASLRSDASGVPG